jgi:hypothetical protein
MNKRSRLRQLLDFLIDSFYQLISLRSNTYRWKRCEFDRARQKHYKKYSLTYLQTNYFQKRTERDISSKMSLITIKTMKED